MKALTVLASALALSGCIYAGEISFLPERDDFVAGLSSYGIEYLDRSGPKLIRTETVTESDFAPNKMLTAYKGYSVADTKTYSPLFIKAEKKYDIIGRVEIDDLVYAVVPNPEGNDAFLVRNDGTILDRLGIIRGDKLKLLDTKHRVEPEDFRFEPVTTSKVVQSELTWGFEIKYAGIKLGRMVFTVLEYDPTNGESGQFVNYNYPNRPGEISIRGLKIRVYEADDEKIAYMIIGN